jgi:hypothetical protein
VSPGDEVLGFCAVLLGLGTSTVTASVLPVPAEATVTFMVALHRALADGTGPAEGLYAARRAVAGVDDLSYAAAAAFACFGAGGIA